MAHYNHFSECPYLPVMFKDINIGAEFRRAKYTGTRRSYIAAIKTSETTYTDKKSKIEHKVFPASNYRVYSQNHSI